MTMILTMIYLLKW